uniref:Sodium-dependent nutrient amino acid transporter 1 n=1 Tax=Culicoides sonorensis TaxID=179676 RepID=A0A336KCW2_CULSO
MKLIEEDIKLPDFELKAEIDCESGLINGEIDPDTKKKKERDQWGNGIEFLFSCIAMSVGLGNIWRFPAQALENGGGAFLIPYLIVLLVLGKPVYYLEMLVGQFSSRGTIKVFDLCPAMRGLGYSQTIACGVVSTFYAAILGLTFRYFFASFNAPLPWTECLPQWSNENQTCISASEMIKVYGAQKGVVGSASFYFGDVIFHAATNLDNGIGIPDWKLGLCVLLAWTLITTILAKGVHSSGKASYFLAIFPYVVMFVLLIRACTLPGAVNGIKYFFMPQWDKLLDGKVWYAAVTQVFFSLTICFGNILMYASYNKFSYNIYRDVNIVTGLDTFTSIMSGTVVFGILGHLAEVTGVDDIKHVVKDGAGLAFISYPDAIAKFGWYPQIFAVIFFLMLLTLGIGSNVGISSCIMTAIRDQFPNLKSWKVAICIGVVSCSISFIYITPGGLFMIDIADFFGATFVAFLLAIAEIITIAWIYGVNRICKDAEFMLGIKTGYYWRICWGLITPSFMATVLVYYLSTLDWSNPIAIERDDTTGEVLIPFPTGYKIIGYCLTSLIVLQVPVWMVIAIMQQKSTTLVEKIFDAFKPTADWGPRDPDLRVKYLKYLKEVEYNDNSFRLIFIEKGLTQGFIFYVKKKLFG